MAKLTFILPLSPHEGQAFDVDTDDPVQLTTAISTAREELHKKKYPHLDSHIKTMLGVLLSYSDRAYYPEALHYLATNIPIIKAAEYPNSSTIYLYTTRWAVVLVGLNRLEEARTLLTEALVSLSVPTAQQDESIKELHILRAEVLCLLSHYEEAKPQLSDIINVLEQERGEQDNTVKKLKMLLADTLYRLHHYQEALPFFQVSLVYLGEKYGPNHDETRAAQCQFIELLGWLERYADVKKFIENILLPQLIANKVDKIFIDQVKFILATTLHELGENYEAIEILNNIFRTYEGITTDAARCLIAKANVLLSKLKIKNGKNIRDAQILLRQALMLGETQNEINPQSIKIDIGLDVAASGIAQKQFEEAKKIYAGVLNDAMALLGQDHPHVANMRKKLAALLLENSESHFEEPEALLIKALEYYQKYANKGPQHAKTLFFLGKVCLHQANFPQAQIYFNDALAIYKHLPPDEDNCQDQIALTKIHLGWLLAHHDKKYEEAKAYYEQALPILSQTCGESHSNVVNANADYAKIVTRLKKQARLPAPAQGSSSSVFVDPREKIDEYSRQGTYALAEHDFAEAIRAYTLALELAHNFCAYDRELQAQLYFHLGIAYFKSKRYKKAEAFLAEAVNLSPENSRYIQRRANCRFLLESILPLVAEAKAAYRVSEEGEEEEGDYNVEAASKLEQALEKLQTLEAKDFCPALLKARLLYNLSLCYSLLGREAADIVPLLTESLKISQEIFGEKEHRLTTQAKELLECISRKISPQHN